MLAKFVEYRALFLRYFADISTIYCLDYLRVKTIIRRYHNDISQRLRSGDNSPQRYFGKQDFTVTVVKNRRNNIKISLDDS